MTDIQNIYSILLARGYQDQLFSSLTGSRKKEGKETRADCPLCHSEGNFSYSSQKPLWRCWSCGESGDWIRYLQKVSGYDFQRAVIELAEMAGVSVSSDMQAGYKAYTRKADILERAQKYFMDQLQDRKAEEVWQYVWKRGYDFDSIYDMEIGAYTDRPALQALLRAEGYTDQEIKASGLLTPGFGEDYQLTLLWKDQAGRAIGIVGRPILEDAEIKSRGLSKYKYSAGMEKDKGLIGFSSSRGSDQIVLVEGVLDGLFLNHKGFKSVAVGGTSLSATQLQALEMAGTKELLLALDMDDPGQKATERLIKSLTTSKLRVYVVSLPEGYKDPDELVRKKDAEAFQQALDRAERWPAWMARRIVSRHDLTTDRGMDQAIEESLDIYTGLDDSLQARGFMDSLMQATGLSKEDLDSRLIKASERASISKAQALLQSHLVDLQQKAGIGDITGAEADLSKALRDISRSRGVIAPEAYLLSDLEEDILTTPPAMTTGYQKLDDLVRIPVGALTIIAGRPGHGKTTFQLNLLVNMIRAYPDKAFYFFSYEEARKTLAVKLLMIMAGVTISQKTNYGAYVHYLKDKRGSDLKIERAVQDYEKLTSAGRLLLSDRMYSAEDLTSVIGLLAKRGDTGAVIVDYIQKIPLTRPTQSQRYLEIKQISSLLLEQAVRQDIPIILGAQLGRDATGSPVKLDNLRESGDIEQDANLVIGLYTEAVQKIQEEAPTTTAIRQDPEVDMDITILKNRTGISGRSLKMTFNRPILTITE